MGNQAEEWQWMNFTQFDSYHLDYLEYDYTYLYRAFPFERPVYLYIWEIMVILTTIFNILMILVLSARGMLNATNAVLIAIAVADSVTGLVTLPTYIHVFQLFLDEDEGGPNNPPAYSLSKGWCQAFLISKFFLSKSFHTMSIWLTVLLGLQRFIVVRFPLKAKIIVTVKTSLFAILGIVLLSPFLHLYHLFDDKTKFGLCTWIIEHPCLEGCVYLWFTFFFMHFIPCTGLVILTALMLASLLKATDDIKRLTTGTAEHTMSTRRMLENRRLSFIVVTVVIVFMIPEIIYGVFLLINTIRHHSAMVVMTLKANHAFHLVYELLLLASFHANFWVYTLMSKSFRNKVKSKLCTPVKTVRKSIRGRRT